MAAFPLSASYAGIDPATAQQMADANKMFGQAAMLGAAGSMIQPPPAASPLQVYTPEMLQGYIDKLGQYAKQMEAIYGTPSTAPGVSVTQTSEIPGRSRKQEAYKQYLINKGVDPKEAARLASGNKFRDDKGFKRTVRQGEFEDLGLFIQGGRVKAKPMYEGGGVKVDPQSEALRGALQALSLQSIGSIGNMLSQGFNQDGLSPRQAQNLDALKAKYLDEFSDVYRDSTRAALGELVNTGTNRSSFAPQFIADTAGKAQSRFLTQALGTLAGQEEQMLQGRAARQAQALQNYRTGLMNPASLGLFSDPIAAQFAANLQQQNIGNRAQTQTMFNQGLLQPVSVMPDASKGIAERGMGALSGAAAGAAAGSIIPGIGTGIGAVIGGLSGLF